ncbi:MCE family protein [Gordonia sp. CPCC 205333]|uniref:MCE family protein n=1 Tax=Gordonia sp. CPCC 205333 TaxID=3140790 RepID=UPI003AF34AC5
MNGRRFIAVPVVLLCASVIAGCAVTVEELPLPRKGVGGDHISVRAEFADALNLPIKAPVKLNGVKVGEVTDIATANYRARVTFELSDAIDVPANSTAELRQATPLGDVFVALQRPASNPSPQRLVDGSVIEIDDTAAAPSVEQIMAAASTVINGGGLARVGSILSELNTMLDGQPSDVASMLSQLTAVTSRLAANSDEITSVLGSLNALSQRSAVRANAINDVIASATPALTVLTDTTDQLVTTLDSARRTSDQISKLVNGSRAELTQLLAGVNLLTKRIGALDTRLEPALSALSRFGSLLAPSIRGDYVASHIRVSSIAIPATYDPNSHWWQLSDLGLIGASLVDTLNRVWTRLRGPNTAIPRRGTR